MKNLVLFLLITRCILEEENYPDYYENMIEVDYLDDVIIESTTREGNPCDSNSILLILTFNTLLIFF